MSGTVLFDDGSLVPWPTLVRRFPDTTFRGPAHVEICRRLAATAGASADELPTLENLLYAKSGLARELTALAEMVSRRPEEVRAIRGPYPRSVLEGFLGVEVPPRIEVESDGRGMPELVSRNVALGFVLRAVAHRLFRIVGWRGQPVRSPRVLRTWVEVSLQIFAQEHEAAEILMYPFPLSPKRQWRYWRGLRRGGRRVRAAGLPYRFSDLVRVLAAPPGPRRALVIVRAEARAAGAHARELGAAGVREFLTSEEFEFGSWALSAALREAGIRVVNSAHGAGPYCPRVAYDEFRVMTPAQASYYRHWPTDTRFTRRLTQNSALALPVHPSFDPGLVFIYQFRDALDLPYERNLQAGVISALAAAAKSAGLRFTIKGHPNQPESELEELRHRTGAHVVRRWEEIGFGHPIVFLIHSTIYFELVTVAPVFVLYDPVLSSALVLGDQIIPFTLSAIRDAMSAVTTAAGWKSHLTRQETQWEAAWLKVIG